MTYDVGALLDDLDEALTERDAMRADLARVSEELGLPPGIGPAPGELRKLRLVADQHTRLRAVAEAGREVCAAWTMHTDQSTRSGTLGMLRAALRAWEGRER